MLTRGGLEGLNENDLREGVLKPLFERLGFFGVRVYHGGILEQGKDLAMWKIDEVGRRKWHAVVAKASKVSGAVSARSGVTEVITQIQQALGREFDDPETLEPARVAHCWFVCSKPLEKEASHALKSALDGGQLTRNVTVVDGDALWRLVEEHLPPSRIWQQLSEVETQLESLDPDFRAVVTRVGAGSHEIAIRAKNPEAGSKKLSGKIVLSAPNTPEGLHLRAALERMIKAGDSVTIEQEFIKLVELPSPLRELLGPTSLPPAKIQIGPKPSNRSMTAELWAELAGSPRVVLAPVILQMLKAGTEEITIGNPTQAVPWRVRVVVNATTQEANLSWSMNLLGHNVRLALLAIRFWSLTSGSCYVGLCDQQTGLSLFQYELPGGASQPPDPDIVAILEDAAFIQESLRVPLTLPLEGLTRLEAEEIRRVAKVLRTGREELAGTDCSATVAKGGARMMLDLFGGGKTHSVAFDSAFTTKLLGAALDLGPAVIRCERVGMVSEALQRFEAIASGRLPDEEVRVALEAAAGCPWIAEYQNWSRASLKGSAAGNNKGSPSPGDSGSPAPGCLPRPG